MQKGQVLKLDYEYCKNNENHHDEHKNLICLEQYCKNKIICVICRYQNHNDHQVTLLKKVLKQNVSTIRNSNYLLDLNLTDIEKTIQQKQRISLEYIDQLKKDFEQCVSNIKNQISQFYKSLLNKTIQIQNIINHTQEQLYDLKHFQKYVELSSFCKVDAKLRITESVNLFEKNKNQIQKQIKHWIDKYKVITPFPWIAHPNIEINVNKIKSIGPNGYKFAYLNWNLGNQKKILKYHIIHDTSNLICIGVCHKKVIEAKNNVFTYNSIGHGAYLISSNGSSWSHIKPEMNNCIKSFKFFKGQKIIVQYDPLQRKVRFRKQDSKNIKDKYQLDIETQEANDLRFCVAFYYPNDQIEVLVE